MFKVQKKDGRLEDFQRGKLIGGVIKSGATPQEAEAVATKVEDWLPTIATTDQVVKTLDLRNKVLEVLRQLNPSVAASFESYHK